MKASLMNPRYTVYVVADDTKYNVTPAVVGLGFSDQKKQISKSCTIQLDNVKVDEKRLRSHLSVRNRVYVYANDGEESGEVFRGYVWSITYKSSLQDWTLQLKCYDNLIYFQESDESAYFSSGKKSKDIVSSLCKDWGIKLNYSYESITHSKLALRGKLADIITGDILDKVKERKGKEYVVLSEKDTIYIKPVGSNTTIYHFLSAKNAVYTGSEITMDGMITKVKILGKEDSKGREPVEATVKKNTSQYGTLQKIIDRGENTSLANAKKEAQSIIDEYATPQEEFELRAPDIPWVRKGDKVYVDAGDIKGYFIANGIDRSGDLSKREMTLTLVTERKEAS